MRIRTRGEDIRRFIIANVEKHPLDISKQTAVHFQITRQAVNKHISRLVSEHTLIQTGQTRNQSYKLVPIMEERKRYQISTEIAEDVIWTRDIHFEEV